MPVLAHSGNPNADTFTEKESNNLHQWHKEIGGCYASVSQCSIDDVIALAPHETLQTIITTCLTSENSYLSSKHHVKTYQWLSGSGASTPSYPQIFLRLDSSMHLLFCQLQMYLYPCIAVLCRRPFHMPHLHWLYQSRAASGVSVQGEFGITQLISLFTPRYQF